MPNPSRSRSRSPRVSTHRRSRRERSHSPRRHQHHHRKRNHSPAAVPVRLPKNASPLTKDDFRRFKNVFALYLDVQKDISLENLDDREARGRWKSFVNKWNGGRLAEGWYDPETHVKANGSARSESQTRKSRPSPTYDGRVQADDQEESDDDAIGPALPGQDYFNNRKSGPGIPSRQDLELRDEMTAEDTHNEVSGIRNARKLDRQEQKERLNELVPRAEPGSRERQFEKKREAAAAARSFREAKSPDLEEVREGDLMGDDGVDNCRARKKEDEKKKNEREIRKEEILRARAAEREERVAQLRAKEEKTMEMLKAIAKQRFG